MGSGVKLYTAHEQWLLCPSHVLLKRDGSVRQDPPCATCEIAHRRPPQLAAGLAAPALAGAPRRARPAQRDKRWVARALRTGRAPRGDRALRARAARRRTCAASPAPYFLYPGRLEPIKGVETLIEAWRRGRAEDLLIAGDGGLRRLHKAAEGMPNVHFVGQLSVAELAPPLYRDAIAVVMPTLGHEVLPLVPLEAFTTGTPAVVRRFGALEELVEETGAGFTAPPPS